MKIPFTLPIHRSAAQATCETLDPSQANSSQDLVLQTPRSLRLWQEILLVTGVITVVTCLFYYEVVFMGRTVLPLQVASVMGVGGPYGYTGPSRLDLYHIDPGASTWYSEPAVHLVGESYARGHFPLWNAFQGFGAPLLAAGQPGGLDLLHFPLYFFDSAVVWDAYFLARLVLGGVITYFYGRYLGLSLFARYFLAIAFVFSGHFFLFASNMWIEAYLLLPAILLAIDFAVRDFPRMGFVLIAVTVALCFLVGMPEVTLCILLFCAGYTAYRIVELGIRQGFHRAWIARVILVAGSWIVGVMIAAPLLLPLFEFIGVSAQIAANRTILGLRYAPLDDFIGWIVPYLNGWPREFDKNSLARSTNTYVGVIVVMLAIYGVYPVKRLVYIRVVPFATLAAALLLAKQFGVPGINEVGRLPGLDVTSLAKWTGPIIGFCLALLASVGVHQVTTERIRPALVTAIFAICTLLILLGLWAKWGISIHVPMSHVWIPLGVAFFFATSAAIGLHAIRPHTPSVLRGVACCGLLVSELFVYAPQGVYQDRHDRFTKPPYISFLQGLQQQSPQRIFASDGLLYPNYASAYDLQDIRLLDALYIDRYLLYIQNFVSPTVTDRFVGTNVFSNESDPQIVGNPWFDLTGVRYVVTPSGSATATHLAVRDGIVNNVPAQGPASGTPVTTTTTGPLTIDGLTKWSLIELPPTRMSYPLRLQEGRAILRFSVAMGPASWYSTKSDGAGFAVVVEAGGKQETVYRRDLHPTSNPLDRKWFDASIDLSQFAGQQVVVTFVADPLANPDDDVLAWGDVRLSSKADDAPTQYRLIYQKGVQIYENQNAIPRAFLAPHVIPAHDMQEALAIMKGGQVDPHSTAVVEGLGSAQLAGLGADGGDVRIDHYSSDRIEATVDAKSSSILVLTDSFYPGWRATIDGSGVEIFPADLMFRGILVPAGRHRIEFSYVPTSFYRGLMIAGVGSLLLLATPLGIGFWRRRSWQQADLPKRRKPNTVKR